MARRGDTKISWQSRVLGTLLSYVVQLLGKTLRVTVVKHPDYSDERQYVYAFWHGTQLLPGVILTKERPGGTILVSPSHDGDLATVCLQKLGYHVIRGSSRDGNIPGLVQLMRRFKQGFSIGFPVDGPIGPRHKVKPGALFIAQKLNSALIPFGVAYKSAWVLSRTWDRTEIPKPFTKAALYIGQPLELSAEMSIEECALCVEQNIHEAQRNALALL